MALLPPETRDVLVQRFVEERSHAEIAERLGLSEGAATLRLHRGKLAFRRALGHPDLSGAAAAYGLAPPENGEQETRIACPFCGRANLLVRLDRAAGTVSYRCAKRCTAGPDTVDGTIIGIKTMLPETAKLTSAKSILTRELLDLGVHYGQAQAAAGAPCPRCGAHTPLEQWTPGGAVASGASYGIRLCCAVCGDLNMATLWHLALDTAAAQRFWRRHPRMRALPVREITAGGRPALLSGFESLDAGARFDVVTARDTYQILAIDGIADGNDR